ncbi:protein adenylyltransferase Fic [Fructobacillus ficulneus]|uniref:protein adenylyltransferase n=1 Tax=Fructobacillus ficulneus TaxID=157463 RepID=A0A0K8MJI4_9LACO|nr:Fic family protein [Fructobacillus ficulneus]GAP00344.1 mobilization/cell filamentation protein-like protein [Fructobacillus ficulneus]
MLDNKLGLKSNVALAEAEERLTKQRAKELYDSGLIEQIEVGTYRGLAQIHHFLFQDIYDFAGQQRKVNLAKGNFRFVPVMYLHNALASIDNLPQASFDDIIAKYVEMNVAHPFREGNGRATRIWLDLLLKESLGQVIHWPGVNPEDYLLAMERSPVRSTEIKTIIFQVLTNDINNRDIYMKGIDQSYAYEGYQLYQTADLGGREKESRP